MHRRAIQEIYLENIILYSENIMASYLEAIVLCLEHLDIHEKTS